MKFLKIIYHIFIIFIALIALLLIVSIFPITGNIKFMVVQSGSMEPAIKMGGVVMIKPVGNYEIGDVITFQLNQSIESTTHRIYDIKVIEGNPVFITKGDANNATDKREIRKDQIVGKVLLDVPYLGYAVDFVKRPIGFSLIIIIPALLIIFDEIRKIFKESKKQKKL